MVGWSFWEGDQLLHVGTWDLEKGRVRGSGKGYRWQRLYGRLDALVEVSKLTIDRIAYEYVSFESGRAEASHRWGGAEAIVEMWAESLGIPLVRIDVRTVKKLATGKQGGPKADKPAMLAAARKRADWKHLTFPDDNAADAAFVGLACVLGLKRVPKPPKSCSTKKKQAPPVPQLDLLT